jgi:hypothetical protein
MTAKKESSFILWPNDPDDLTGMRKPPFVRCLNFKFFFLSEHFEIEALLGTTCHRHMHIYPFRILKTFETEMGASPISQNVYIAFNQVSRRRSISIEKSMMIESMFDLYSSVSRKKMTASTLINSLKCKVIDFSLFL